MSTSLINSVANTTAHRDRDDLDRSIAALLLKHLDAESVIIYRLINDHGVKRVMRRIGITKALGELGPEELDDMPRAPVLTDMGVWEECVSRHTVTQYAGANGAAFSVFPVENEREVVGILEVESKAPLQERDAHLVVGILRILKNHLALLDYGERDTLTGLLNRKTFEANFYKLRQRRRHAEASNEPSWLGVIDIDHFKSINDTYGHLFGDEVLLLVAQLMKQSFRAADHMFRFGGEEFVVALDRASASGAQIAFERLRTRIESYAFPQVHRVTVSLGYTQIDPRDGPSTCVERADAALYYAKHNGRNLVCHYESLVNSGKLAARDREQNTDIELF